ncbi:MAG: hypothetical protein JG766_1625, partial [Desulfacinum sp.]|nr:hypothetical protein [Desulfacinum sp.]
MLECCLSPQEQFIQDQLEGKENHL